MVLPEQVSHRLRRSQTLSVSAHYPLMIQEAVTVLWTEAQNYPLSRRHPTYRHRIHSDSPRLHRSRSASDSFFHRVHGYFRESDTYGYLV